MKLTYDADSDSLYIDLLDATSAETRELLNDFVVDYDEAGEIVGFDVQNASKHMDLSRVQTVSLL